MKTVDFSETVAACDLKSGRNRHLIEFMKVCEYLWSGSFLDLDPRSCMYIQIFKQDFLRNYCAILNQILYESFRYKEMKIR